MLDYEAGMPSVIPGSTSLGISARVLSELQTTGRARLTLVYSPQLASIDCNLVRLSATQMMSLIVEDRVIEIDAIHAQAECGEGTRTGYGDFYFANNRTQPLLLESYFSWEKRPRTERITRVMAIIDPNDGIVD